MRKLDAFLLRQKVSLDDSLTPDMTVLDEFCEADSGCTRVCEYIYITTRPTC